MVPHLLAVETTCSPLQRGAVPAAPLTARSVGQHYRSVENVSRILVLLFLLSLAGCKRKAPCVKACRFVEHCKKEAREGRALLGEGKPEAKQECLDKCKNHPEDFAACEGRFKTCKQLRTCYGPLR